MILTAVAPPGAFLLFASLGNACRGISYMIWGATHTFFAKNFALQNNVGDISAKADSQMVVAHLGGLAAGIGLISLHHSAAFLLLAFGALVPLQLSASVQSLRACHFEVLNHTKALLLLDEFVARGTVPSPSEMRRSESWFGEWVTVRTPNVQIGVAVADAFATEDQLRHSLDTLVACVLSLGCRCAER
jgi:hypothetical protein